MLVVVPFFSGDAWLAEKNLLWARELDPSIPNEGLLAYDEQTNPAKVREVAKLYFSRLHEFKYARPLYSHWPWPQNNAFGNVHRYIEAHFKCPWLWWETDSVPLKSGWVKTLQDEYYRGKKPFGGHWNPEAKIFNGVAIYPNSVSTYSYRAATCDLLGERKAPHDAHYQPPWDAHCSTEVFPRLHVMNHIMQHIWNLDGKDISFPDAASVLRLVRKDVVLFHRCKDGTLIDRLRENRNLPLGEPVSETIVHVKTTNEPANIPVQQEERPSCGCTPGGCDVQRSPESVLGGTPNVPAPAKKRGRPPRQCCVPTGNR